MRPTCKHCKHLLVEPAGDRKSKWLLVGEFPGWEELREGRPFVGRAGEVLQSELAHHGHHMSEFRITNLWLHGKDEKDCNPKWHLDQLYKEMKNKTHILLMGSDVTVTLFDKKVSDISGTRMAMKEFPKTHIWIAPNPAIVFHSPPGELKMAIERFCKDLK